MYLDLVEFLQREHHRFIPYRRVDLSWFRREISLEACNSLIHYGTGRHDGYEIIFSLFNERRTQIKPLNSKTAYMNIWYDRFVPAGQEVSSAISEIYPRGAYICAVLSKHQESSHNLKWDC